MVIAQVVDRQNVWVIAQLTHYLGFTGYAGVGGFIRSFGFYHRDGYVPVEDLIMGQVDFLSTAFTQKAHDTISSIGKRGRLGLGGGRLVEGEGLCF